MEKRKDTVDAIHRATAALMQLSKYCLSAADTLSKRSETVDEDWLKRTVWDVWYKHVKACNELEMLLYQKDKGKE